MTEARALVEQMTLEEKASLCSGGDFWHLQGLEKYGLPAVMVTDGPHGLRKQEGAGDHLGIGASVPAVCFPPACATACSFDRALLAEIGDAMGEACQAEDVAVVLGPGANIKRSPLCGRNFEYFSEDPYLTGELAAALIRGVESRGVGTSLKHFAVNNQERRRMTVNAVVDERALREIYLAGFETAVRRGRPQTVMCSYNRINGVYASEHRELLTGILRRVWGFDGLVITDWGAANDRVEGIRAGLDLEMPSSEGEGDRRIVRAVRAGRLDEKLVDECAARVVRLILDYGKNHIGGAYDQEAQHRLARRAAARSAVLLKNDGGTLPLSPGTKVAVLGEFARAPRYQGAGSSKIRPTRLDIPLEELEAAGLEVAYAPGYRPGADDPRLIEEAAALAAEMDMAVVFAGLPDEYESEGFDRGGLDMPESHNALIAAVAAANPNTVVVLMCGSPVSMPWRDRVRAILLMYLGGQAVGGAAADLLCGAEAPGGKLAETFPLAPEDCPCHGYFPGGARTAEYRESIFVGYRWYDTAARPVLYPFGHGLSYSTFSLSGLTVDGDGFRRGDRLTARVTVTNTGDAPGYEVAQLYITGCADSAVCRPAKELKGFEKVYLQPGQSKEVTFTLDERSFAYYNTAASAWAIESGLYTLWVGTSSRDLACTARLRVTGDGLEKSLPDYRDTAPVYFHPPKAGPLEVDDAAFTALYGAPLPPSASLSSEPFTVNSTLEEIGSTFLGRRIIDIAARELYKMEKDNNSDIKTMMEASAMEMPLRTFAAMSGGRLTLGQLDGIVDMLNGKWPRGLMRLLKK